MKLSVLCRSVALFAALVLPLGTSLAQETAGALQGTVKDASGAVVPAPTSN